MTIDDKAAVYFTKMFYENIFISGKTICHSFFDHAKPKTNEFSKEKQGDS